MALVSQPWSLSRKGLSAPEPPPRGGGSPHFISTSQRTLFAPRGGPLRLMKILPLTEGTPLGGFDFWGPINIPPPPEGEITGIKEEGKIPPYCITPFPGPDFLA